MPQLEQNQIFNAVNFSQSPWTLGQTTAAITKVASLICPSESASLQLYPIYPPSGGTVFYAVSSYVGNYGGPAAYAPYTGTIIPEADLGATGLTLTPVGIQSITDGTSNTGLFSEHLVAGYPVGTAPTPSGPAVYPGNGPNALRAIFQGSYAAQPNSVTAQNMNTQNPALLFAQGCQAIPATTTSIYSTTLGVMMLCGYPMHCGLTSYMHWTAPNTPPCNNPADASWLSYVGPYGSVSATSQHPGGVNVGFADGSVHFVKNSISLQTWWALGTRANGEVISSDQY